MIAIFLLPYLSEALPHEALVTAQAIAEIEKIVEVSITDSPRSRANGGTRTNAKDCPKPTENNPNFSQAVGLDNLRNAHQVTKLFNQLFCLRPNFSGSFGK